MSTFGAVAGVQTEWFVCWSGEFDLATLAAGVHTHLGVCLVWKGVCLMWWGVGGVGWEKEWSKASP